MTVDAAIDGNTLCSRDEIRSSTMHDEEPGREYPEILAMMAFSNSESTNIEANLLVMGMKEFGSVTMLSGSVDGRKDMASVRLRSRKANINILNDPKSGILQVLFRERPQDIADNLAKQFSPDDKVVLNIYATNLLQNIAEYTSFKGGSASFLSESRMVLFRYYHPDLELASASQPSTILSK